MHTRPPAILELFRRTWKIFTRPFTTEVPGALSCCEFDCRRPECAPGEWSTCERRLEHEKRAQQNATKQP